ncbi:MAG: phosphoribulokinase [Methanomicrobiales archaeon]|nr:phosphoribulokinase [Methanomicrobiales archaeon]
MEERSPFHAALSAIPGTYIIGVAGDSGSGKTTFTAALRHLFGDRLVSTITLDDYHLYDREERRIRNITPLAPEANNLEGLEEDLRTLKAGRPVRKKVYNHTTGMLEGPVEFSPSRILILEGLHTLFTPGLRELMDFSLYVDPAPDVKREWKIKRDTGKRGYSEVEVMEEIRRRQADYSRYIAPQRKCADAVVTISFSRFGRELGWTRNIYRITLLQTPVAEPGDEIGFSIALPLLATTTTCPFSLEYGHRTAGGREMAALTIDGECDQRFLPLFLRYLGKETGIDPAIVVGDRKCLSPSGLVQLMFCWRIIREILTRA